MQPALQPAQVPVVPAAPTAPVAPVFLPAPAAPLAAPRTAAEAAGLQARTAELRDQLRSTQRLRDQVLRDVRRDRTGDRSELGQFATTLDGQLVQIRSDIASNEQLLAATPPNIAASVQPRREFLLLGPNGPSPNAVPVLLFLVLALQVFLLRRGRGRRRDASASEAMLRDSAARLARVEQAVDAIAVEVERVSEGQRFVSRLLSERPPAPAIAPAPPRQYTTPH